LPLAVRKRDKPHIILVNSGRSGLKRPNRLLEWLVLMSQSMISQ
jgi:hypothetical protein